MRTHVLSVSLFLAACGGADQQADGSVVVPEALRPYAGGLERITPRRDG